jgi:hypothetical protein
MRSAVSGDFVSVTLRDSVLSALKPLFPTFEATALAEALCNIIHITYEREQNV